MFFRFKGPRGPVWFAVGVAAGLVVACLWPSAPLHAVSTDRTDTFAIATGLCDENIEAIYFLDFLTGDVRAAALSKQTGKFNAFFAHNVCGDFHVDPSKNPKFLMVTGVADLRRVGGARIAPSRSIIYIAEITTGQVAAYSIPWSTANWMANVAMKGGFVLLDMARFRTAAAPVGGAAAKE
jgi:hypothetical protein